MLNSTGPLPEPSEYKSKPKKKQPVVPNGLKEYFFDLNGKIYKEHCDNCVFKCYALNEKNAKRKFKNCNIMEKEMKEIHGHTVEHWKQNAEENYITTPISVLKYITVLEEVIQISLEGLAKNGHLK